MQLGFVSAILPELSLTQVLAFAAEAGFDCVEVMCWPTGKAERRYAGVTHLDVTNFDKAQAEQVHKLTTEHGVAISGLGYYPNPLSADAGERQTAAAHLQQVIRAAALLGINRVNTFVGRDPKKSIDDNWPTFLDVWRPLIRLAEEQKVRVGIENCPMYFTRDEWPSGKNLAISPAVWRRMFAEIRSDYFGLNYDPSHLVWQQMDHVRPLIEFASKLFHVHAKDVRVDREKLNDVGILATPLEYHCPKLPGLGEIDWGRFFSVLGDTGYAGPVCIEVEDRAYEGSLAARKRALVQSGGYLRQFMGPRRERCLVKLLASVDLGGTNIKCAVAREDGHLLLSGSIPTESHLGPAGVLRRVTDLVSKLASEAGGPIAALGMAAPGLVDLASGETRFLPNMPTQWRNVPVGKQLSEALRCDVFLLNDARAATLGELVFGHGRQAQNLALFTLGTGVGGGVVIEGKLRLGPLGAAGELGHQTILLDGPLCGCGNRGCLETLASGPALIAAGVRLLRTGMAPRLHDLVGGDLSRITPREMAVAAEQGDLAVRDAIHTAARYLGVAAANVVVFFHPQMIVLGGGVAGIGPLLVDTVRQTVRDSVGMFPTTDVAVELSQLADEAGLYGGIALAMRAGHV